MLAERFIQARNYSPSNRAYKDIRLIVLHSEESPETATSAIDVAEFFHNQIPSPYTGSSAHVTVDSTTIVQCVMDKDTAWAAPGANEDGLHIEQAGYAAQNRPDWLDPYSKGVIHLAAKQAAYWINQGASAPKLLTVSQVADRQTRGVCTHAMVTSAALDPSGTHTDPGPNYPLDVFMSELNTWLNPSKGRKKMYIATLNGRVWLTDGLFKRELDKSSAADQAIMQGLTVIGVGQPWLDSVPGTNTLSTKS